MNEHRRHRAPNVTVLLILLGVVAAAATATAVVLAITFGARLNTNSDRLDGEVRRLDAVVHRTIPDQRKDAIESLCRSTEAVKRDARRVFRRFGITPAELPRGRGGRRPFDPVAGGCAARARALVGSRPPRRYR